MNIKSDNINYAISLWNFLSAVSTLCDVFFSFSSPLIYRLCCMSYESRSCRTWCSNENKSSFLSSPRLTFLSFSVELYEKKERRKKSYIYSIILFNTFSVWGWMKIKTAAIPDEQQQQMQKIKIRWKQFFIFSRCLVSCWNLSKMVELWKCFCNNYGRNISSEHVESNRGRILLFVNISTTIIIEWNDVNNEINEIN